MKISLSLLVEDAVWHMLDSLMDSLHAGELGVDDEEGVFIFVSLSVWIAIYCSC